MYATPTLFSRAASELSGSGATTLDFDKVEKVMRVFLTVNMPLSGSPIPSTTAINAANGYAARMRFRIVTRFSRSFPVLGDEKRPYSAARAHPILAALLIVVNGFR